MPELLAVRHGETTLNAVSRLTGQLDPPLTARGREQAAALAPLLRAAGPFDLVVHSGTRRTAQTLAAAGIDPAAARADPRLLERSFGELEGEPHERWVQPPDLHAAPPGGESYAQLAARVVAGLADLPRSGRVLLCAHSGVLRVLGAVADPARDVAAFLAGGAGNAAVVRLTYASELTMPPVFGAAPRS